MKWLGALIALAALSAAGVGIASSTSAAKAPTCPPKTKTSTSAKRIGYSLRADVTGDGRPDVITMRAIRGSECRLLVVRTRSRVYSDRVASGFGSLRPRLAIAVRLDPRKSQIVVIRDRGAATISVTLYGLVRGHLRRLTIAMGNGVLGVYDELTLDGSVTTWTGAACRRGGPLELVGFSAFGGKRPAYSLHTYRLHVHVFVDRAERVVRRTKPPRWWKREAGKPNFAGCVTAGNPHRLD